MADDDATEQLKQAFLKACGATGSLEAAKAAAKAEKARLKALAKAEAEKADVKAIAPPTPPGEKKILAEQMARTYNPGDVEAAWQDWWEKSGWYGCDEKQALKRPADEK